MLPEIDHQFLAEKGIEFEIQQSGGDTYVLIKNFKLPEAYSPTLCTLLLKLPPGYPASNPDMFWTTPGVRLKTGNYPIAADVHEIYVGIQWQRWSRHSNTWRSGVDNLKSKLRSVQTELCKGR
jgi:hypothetical protein